MSKCSLFLKSLSVFHFKLNYHHPEDFLLHRWQQTTQVDGHYLIFRVLFLVIITCQMHLLSLFISKASAHIPYIYFTHWTFLSMGVYALVHLIAVVIGYTHQQSHLIQVSNNSNDSTEAKEGADKGFQVLDLAYLNKLTLAIANIAHNCAVCVTICFWSAFWTQEMSDLTWATKMYHVWLGVVILWNYLVMSIPLRFEHVYLPFGFGLAYSLFSVVFYLCDGKDHKGRRYVYRLVDWHTSPWVALGVVVFSLILVVLVQLALHGLERVKVWIYRKYFLDGHLESSEYIRAVPK